MTRYPAFDAPPHLTVKSPKEWSAREAREYFSWLTQNAERRASIPLSFFSLDASADPEVLLHAVQDRLEESMKHGRFLSGSLEGSALSPEGHSVAADIGLLIACLLIRDSNSRIHWEILRRPRSERSFNLPVLQGCGEMHLDPIVGSISEAGESRICSRSSCCLRSWCKRGEPDFNKVM